MAEKVNMRVIRGRGRPPKPINGAQVEALASIFCTVDEIAAVMDCHKRTLERNFAASIEKGRLRGKESLRRAQFKAALGGNPTMMIWLGKQVLGQEDRNRHEVTGRDGEPLLTLEAVRAVLQASDADGPATVH